MPLRDPTRGSAGIGRQAGLRCLCPTIDVWVQVPSPAPRRSSLRTAQKWQSRKRLPFSHLRSVAPPPQIEPTPSGFDLDNGLDCPMASCPAEQVKSHLPHTPGSPLRRSGGIALKRGFDRNGRQRQCRASIRLSPGAQDVFRLRVNSYPSYLFALNYIKYALNA